MKFIFGHLTKLIGYKQLSYATLISNREKSGIELNTFIIRYRFFHSSDYDLNESAMEPLTSASNGSTTPDPLIDSSNTISRDIGSIKQKLQILIHEHTIHQEWILLAHIINRLCFLVYLFFLSFSIGHHFLF